MTTRPAKPTHHIETTTDTLEALAFKAGGSIELPGVNGGWATLRNRKGSFCAWVPAVLSEVAA